MKPKNTRSDLKFERRIPDFTRARHIPLSLAAFIVAADTYPAVRGGLSGAAALQ